MGGPPKRWLGDTTGRRRVCWTQAPRLTRRVRKANRRFLDVPRSRLLREVELSGGDSWEARVDQARIIEHAERARRAETDWKDDQVVRRGITR